MHLHQNITCTILSPQKNNSSWPTSKNSCQEFGNMETCEKDHQYECLNSSMNHSRFCGNPCAARALMVFKEQLCHFQSHLLPNFSMWAWDIELEWGSCLYTLNRFNETKRWCANCAHSTATATTRTKDQEKTANKNKKRQTANNKMKFHLFCTYDAKLAQLILLVLCYDMSPLKIPINTSPTSSQMQCPVSE